MKKSNQTQLKRILTGCMLLGFLSLLVYPTVLFGGIHSNRSRSNSTAYSSTMFNSRPHFLSISKYIDQDGKQVTLSGQITDAESGEDLIGATVYFPELSIGVTTNLYGFYSITAPAGTHVVQFRYIGYENQQKELRLSENTQLHIKLKPANTELEEVTVTAESITDHVSTMKMSTEKLSAQTLKEVPAFMGEVDVLKTIQSLPGVQNGGEGTTGFFVRGGKVDQNLVQLDEATVYNASHLMGFFSVFNADAIKDVELYKGGVPSVFGGRLSSILDIRMKDGNNQRTAVSGGIGLIASRLTIEGPIANERHSFLITGRRTYADLFLAASNDPSINDTRLYFYDLNGKMNFRLSSKDRLFVSTYMGDDVFSFKNMLNWDWGNRTTTLRWNRVFHPKLFTNFTALYSTFNYRLGANAGPSEYDWQASIRDFSLKADVNWYPNAQHKVSMGISSIHHTFQPGKVWLSSDRFENEFSLDRKRALESALYIQDEIQANDRLAFQVGLRFSLFQNIGGQSYSWDDSFDTPIDTTFYGSRSLHGAYLNMEPRIGVRYQLDDTRSIKASYNRMVQYLHLASNTTASVPLDVYIPTDQAIEPQLADQISVGYFQTFEKAGLTFSAEAFHKHLENQIDFRDNADLMLNNHVERDIRVGQGRAYGLEFMLRKQEGKLSGWISYTWSRSERTIAGINNGESYWARQDRPHVINVIASYPINKRLTLGMNWGFASGMPVTLADGGYYFDGVIVPTYSGRNNHRLPASHRLDLSLTLQSKRKARSSRGGSWNFSVFNAYAQRNPFSIQSRQNADNPAVTEAVRLSLVGTAIPSITYNFEF